MRSEKQPRKDRAPARNSLPARPAAGRRNWIAGAIVVVLIGAGIALWFRPLAGPAGSTADGAAEAPVSEVTSPFQNVSPNVKYVGDGACAGCHEAITVAYRKHPMGRSLAPIATATEIEKLAGDVHNPFDAQGMTYRVERQGDRLIHSESVAGRIENRAPVAFAIGSGRRGRSYLFDRDGFLFQSPISWFPLKGVWDLSPGYDEFNHHFSRPVVPGCLYCHCNQTQPDGHAANRYVSPVFRGHAIGCERCHGPGELHVREQNEGETRVGVDHSIVNPRHLEPALRESVCQQCHLQGESRVVARGKSEFDYRPGLPLNRFVADFVRPASQRSENKFVGTVEQMIASRCYQATTGSEKLGCISCHDPHSVPQPEQRVQFYRDRCLQCHASRGCSVPPAERHKQSAQDSCIDCHMPRRPGSVVHTAITDHAIPRRPAAKAAKTASEPGDWPTDPLHALEPFPPDALPLPRSERDRNLGMALVDIARKKKSGASGRSFAETASTLLSAATTKDPQDTAAWEAQSWALLLAGRTDDAVTAANIALRNDENRETALFLAAIVAAQQKRSDDLRQLATRLIRVNPWMWQYHQMLAEANAQSGNWAQAVDSCRDTIRLEPANVPARQLLIQSYLRLGEKGRARSELDVCLLLLPAAEREPFRRAIEPQLR